jgi:regulator of replication initiation timing
MLKIIQEKRLKDLEEQVAKLIEAQRQLVAINKALEVERDKMKEMFETEKEKNYKEATKKKNMRVEATKKWLTAYPNE